MTRVLVLLLALLPVSFGACARQGTAPPSTQSVSATAPAPLQAPRNQAADALTATAENAASGPDAADASDDVPVGTTSLEKIAEMPSQHQLPNGRWKPGVNYDPVVPAQPTSVPAGKVEVMQAFWYACPHCYDLEEHLAAWRKSKPDYVEFVRVPVMWGPVHRAHAQLYYTLKQLGRNDLDAKVFETLHQGTNPLVGNTPEETFSRQLQFAQANGIDPEAFRKAYNSFAVNSDLQRAEEIGDRYHIEAVPQIIINGKYMTDVGKAGNYENLFAEINDLAAGEHKR
ncbi:MAG TPA: thiol:disulfide interchange protein DsbA/DsbL [Steroidobacteraceae bacterium]|jgi:thiol:disulfide interchange protein DsbA|nr:thiol:disulfide interchange protein DsbA/DsbL [Steroidobacteraceae bacterium]